MSKSDALGRRIARRPERGGRRNLHQAEGIRDGIAALREAKDYAALFRNHAPLSGSPPHK